MVRDQGTEGHCTHCAIEALADEADSGEQRADCGSGALPDLCYSGDRRLAVQEVSEGEMNRRTLLGILAGAPAAAKAASVIGENVVIASPRPVMTAPMAPGSILPGRE